MKLWQLKKLSTNEPQGEVQKLPENWGPVFGMAGIQDKLGDLSWLGDAYADLGWVVVGEMTPPAEADEKTLANARAENDLRASDWTMLPDVPMTVAKREEWIQYRKVLREVSLQTGFPTEIRWPTKPE